MLQYEHGRIHYKEVCAIPCDVCKCDVCDNTDTDESNIKKNMRSLVMYATLWCHLWCLNFGRAGNIFGRAGNNYNSYFGKSGNNFSKPGNIFGKPGNIFGKPRNVFGKLGNKFGRNRSFLPWECQGAILYYLKGPADSKNENLYFLAPAQTKRMQPTLVSCEALFWSN